MIKSEFLNESRRIFALNPHIPMPTDDQLEQLFDLAEIMLEVNSYMNLTAITDMTGIILKHFVDSLAVSPYIPENSTVIDVGCGAGFPSLPLAILRPDLKTNHFHCNYSWLYEFTSPLAYTNFTFSIKVCYYHTK